MEGFISQPIFQSMHSYLALEMGLSFLCNTLGFGSSGRDLTNLCTWKEWLGALQARLYRQGPRSRCSGDDAS